MISCFLRSENLFSYYYTGECLVHIHQCMPLQFQLSYEGFSSVAFTIGAAFSAVVGVKALEKHKLKLKS